MVKKSLLKRASYVITALVLMFSAVPILPGKVYAAGSCAENDTDLVQLIGDASMAEINFCDDITLADPLVIMRDVAIDMNGKTLNGAFYIASGVNVDISNGTVYSASRNAIENNGNLTLDNMNITAAGSLIAVYGLNGTAEILGGYYKNENGANAIKRTSGVVTVSGGEFDTDPSGFLADGYSAYKPKNSTKYVVEPTLTNAIFVNTPDLITIKEGEIRDVKQYLDLPADSTTGFIIGSSNTDYVKMNDVKNAQTSSVTGEIVGVNVTNGVDKKQRRITIAPSYDKSIKQTIYVNVESGLKSISVDDISMTQEDTKNAQIRNEYYYGVANGVTYQLVNNTPLQAIVDEQGLITISAGANGVIDAGEYTITANALVNGNVIASDDFTVTVGEVFTDFTLKEADSQGIIKIKEDEWFQLKIDGTTTMGDANNVSIININVLDMSRDGLMHAREDRIAGDRQGAGNATIEVTAKYVSNNGNEYIVTKRFEVEVVSVLESVLVQDEAGVDVQNVVFDRDKTVDLVAKAKSSTAGVYYSAVSDDEDIANVTIDRETGAMHISSSKAGIATIEVKATSKDGSVEKTTVLNVTVNKILETLNVNNISIDQGMGGVIAPMVEDDVDVEYTFEIVGGGLGLINLNRNTGVFSTELGNGKSGMVSVKVTARELTGAEHREKEKIITITVGPVLSSFGLGFTDYFKKTGEMQYEIYEKDTTEILISNIVNSEIKESDVQSWEYEIVNGNNYIELDGKTVKGVKNGVATVKVTGVYTSENGREHYSVDKQITVVVKPLLTGVRIKDENGDSTKPNIPQVLYENDEVTYTVQHINKRASVDYSVQTSDASIATAELDGANLIIKTFEQTTVPGGEAVVTVTAIDRENPNIVASRSIKIAVKPTLKTLDVDDVYLKVGDKETLNIAWKNSAITPEIEYHILDKRMAIKSSGNGIRGMRAGETQAIVRASFDGKTIEKTVGVHVYEMETPIHHHYYGATGEIFDVHVGDKNENAHTIASIDKPWGMVVMGDRVMAFMPGVYTVTYTDYMANGEIVGRYTAEFTVFRVERETVVVARGETKYLDGHSEWGTTSAKDETTGHHVHVNRNGKVVFATDQETTLGVHEVTMKHSFGRDAREIVKRVTVVVYEVTADSKTDPEGITADTLKDYIEGMFTQPTSWEEMIAKMQQAQDLFGTGFESVWSAMGVSGAVMNGGEIATRVEVTELEEVDVDENLISAVEALNVDNVEYYDVSVWMSRDGYDFGRLHQLNNKITVALTTVTDPESGYARKYIVVRQHEGEEPEVLVEGVDFYIEDGVLYVISDRFSTFAVAYTDTMIPAYGGVTYTVKAPETGSIHHEAGNASGSIAITLAMTITAITLAGAAIFAKRK